MKELNKIDRSIIFQEFVRNKPVLKLLSGKNSIVKLESFDYNILNTSIQFSFNEISLDKYTLLFPYKNRLISGEVVLEKKQSFIEFAFPKTLSLYDVVQERSLECELHILTDTKQEKNETHTRLVVGDIEECPVFNFEKDILINQNNSSLLNEIKLMLHYQNSLKSDDLLVARLYYFLQAVASESFTSLSKIDISKKVSILFLSEKIMAFFVSDEVRALLSNSRHKVISLNIGGRFLRISLGNVAGILQINKPTYIQSAMSVMLFLTENVSLEDKRFLYETVYRVKYGTYKKS